MSPALQSLGIDRLSVEEKLRLVEEIWDSIGDDLPIPEWHRQELDRRLAAHDANPDDTSAVAAS